MGKVLAPQWIRGIVGVGEPPRGDPASVPGCSQRREAVVFFQRRDLPGLLTVLATFDGDPNDHESCDYLSRNTAHFSPQRQRGSRPLITSLARWANINP